MAFCIRCYLHTFLRVLGDVADSFLGDVASADPDGDE